MRRAVLAGITAGLLLACGNKSKPAPDPATTAPLLWVVSSDAGPSWLFGTMHLGVDIGNDVNPIVFDKLDRARSLVVEVDTTNLPQNEVMAYAELPPGESLEDKMSPEHWRRLLDIVPTFPADVLRRYRPWFVTVVVTQTMLPVTASMDTTLHQHASARGIEIAFLEDWKYQLELIDAVIGVSDVVDIVDNADDTRKELRDLIYAYKAGDAATIERLMYDPEKYEKNPKVVDVLLERRNREWIPKLVPMIDEGNAFIAVGAGHLIGDEGLVALLRERGYTVERITLPGQARERPAEPAAAGR